MLSRASKRATWAAQLAADAGFKHCLVYDQVSYALHHLLLVFDPWHVMCVAALLSSDTLLICCLYMQGVNGWHMHPEVKTYSHYNVGEPPHEPEAFDLENADPFAAHTELVRLGMVHL